jgi:hypothetical protein
MSECWLEKIRDSELTAPNVTTVDLRNNWSFWEPLDAQFLELMSAMANYKQFAFISPFWSNFLFAYLPYAASEQTIQEGVMAGITAMQQAQFTGTGTAFENSILPAPDTTAPQTPAPPAFVVEPGYLEVLWQTTADNVGVAGYRLYRNGQLVDTAPGTSFNDTRVGVEVSYEYTLSAFDAEGNVSPQSAPAKSPKRY